MSALGSNRRIPLRSKENRPLEEHEIQGLFDGLRSKLEAHATFSSRSDPFGASFLDKNDRSQLGSVGSSTGIHPRPFLPDHRGSGSFDIQPSTEELLGLYNPQEIVHPHCIADPARASAAENLFPSAEEVFTLDDYSWFSGSDSMPVFSEDQSHPISHNWSAHPSDDTLLAGLSAPMGSNAMLELSGSNGPTFDQALYAPGIVPSGTSGSSEGAGGNDPPSGSDQAPTSGPNRQSSEPSNGSESGKDRDADKENSEDEGSRDDDEEDLQDEEDAEQMDAEERRVFQALRASIGSPNCPEVQDRRERAFALLSSYYRKIWPRAPGALPENAKVGRRVAKALVQAIVDITCEHYGLSPDRLWKDIGGFSSLARTTNTWNLYQKRARAQLAPGEHYDADLTHRQYREQASANPDLQLELERWEIENSLPKDERLRVTERQELFNHMAASAKWLFSESEKKSQIGGRFQIVGLHPLDGGSMVTSWETEGVRGMGEAIYNTTLDGERVLARAWTTQKYAAIMTNPPPDDSVDPRLHEGTRTEGVRKMKEMIKEEGRSLLHAAMKLRDPKAVRPTWNRWGPHIEDSMIQYQCTLVNWPNEGPWPHEMKKDLQRTSHDDLRPVWIAYTSPASKVRAAIRSWTPEAVRNPAAHDPPLVIRADGRIWSYSNELARRGMLPAANRRSGGTSLREKSLREQQRDEDEALSSPSPSADHGANPSGRPLDRKGKRRMDDPSTGSTAPPSKRSRTAGESTGDSITTYDQRAGTSQPAPALAVDSAFPAQLGPSDGGSSLSHQPLPPIQTVLSSLSSPEHGSTRTVPSGSARSFVQNIPFQSGSGNFFPGLASSPLSSYLFSSELASSPSRENADYTFSLGSSDLQLVQDLAQGWHLSGGV